MARVVGWSLGIAAALLAAVLLAGAWLWSDRPDPALPVAAGEGEPGAGAVAPVTVTWLGVTTLLFDDGETRLMTDGFFSRPGLLDLLLDRPVSPDLEGIEGALARWDISRLAAVMPVHSHYDHAMDAGEVARRTGALVVGSESTANAARGAGLAEERIVVVRDGDRRRFGRFTVTWKRSRHWPATASGEPAMPGEIEAPLAVPAPITAWREGGSWSIHVFHPSGAALVQGSAGYVEGALAELPAKVVLLGIGGLSRSGPDHARAYWREVVERTGARRVLPVHYDDFTLAYGDVRAFPRIADDLDMSLAWLAELAGASQPPVILERLPFGRPVRLFGPPGVGAP